MPGLTSNSNPTHQRPPRANRGLLYKDMGLSKLFLENAQDLLNDFDFSNPLYSIVIFECPNFILMYSYNMHTT